VVGAFLDDDNGTNSGSAYVFRVSVCGDGLFEPDAGEECDDDNTVSCDGCSEFCEIEVGYVCGDGSVNSDCGEECDDGDGWASDCTIEEDVPASTYGGMALTVFLLLLVSAAFLLRRRPAA
jgi:cysteine-rich repeat protein